MHQNRSEYLLNDRVAPLERIPSCVSNHRSNEIHDILSISLFVILSKWQKRPKPEQQPQEEKLIVPKDH